MKFIIYYCVIACCVFAASVHAKTVFISDIDDTIKPTHVHNLSDALSSFTRTEVFLGLEQLYLSLACDSASENESYKQCLQTKGVSNQKKTSFHYVTGFPFLGVVQNYLALNNFPQNGTVRAKPVWLDLFDFKLRQHLDIVLQEQPLRVVLIGDNGQLDSQVYEALVAEIQKLFELGKLAVMPDFHVYIHSVYDNNLEATSAAGSQNIFLGFFDLGLQLFFDGLLALEQLNRLSAIHRSALENRASRSFGLFLPGWVQCEGYYSWYRDGTDHNTDLYLDPMHRWFYFLQDLPPETIGNLRFFESIIWNECR